MKRITKLLINLLALAVMLVAGLGLVACSNDKTVTVELNLSIYNEEEHANYEDTTLTITLHREYAPKTVEAIVSYIEEGYYDDAIFYCVEDNKIMVGDLKMSSNGTIYQNAVKPQLEPEFERGTVSGAGLKVEEGSIALWRSWYVRDGYDTSASIDTGRATWCMPTTSISSLDEWVCVFATIDLDDDTNKTTLDNLKSAVKTYADTYEVYYTGEYNSDDDVLNNGLTFHCEEEVPNGVTVFEPSGEQYECYKQQQITIARGMGNTCGAKIVSAKIV